MKKYLTIGLIFCLFSLSVAAAKGTRVALYSKKPRDKSFSLCWRQSYCSGFWLQKQDGATSSVYKTNLFGRVTIPDSFFGDKSSITVRLYQGHPYPVCLPIGKSGGGDGWVTIKKGARGQRLYCQMEAQTSSTSKGQ